jgi:hypothetical protein
MLLLPVLADSAWESAGGLVQNIWSVAGDSLSSI